ncbi:MAG: hypothetical protein RRC34_08570 [Lentisphaeria bacterium]|nr:hypothetical protein [Lentisphaeria bacterium]
MMIKAKTHFTLLELLVAVTAFLLLTTVLVAALTGVGNSWRRLSLENRRMRDLLALDRTLDSILSQTVAFSWRDKDDEPFVFFDGKPDSVRLVYRHVPGTYDEGGLRFVDIRVIDAKLVAVYQDRPVEDMGGDFSNASTSVLSEEVDHIELSYADADPATGWQWLDEWDYDTVHSETPPAIAIQVFWRDGRWESWLRRTEYGIKQF